MASMLYALVFCVLTSAASAQVAQILPRPPLRGPAALPVLPPAVPTAREYVENLPNFAPVYPLRTQPDNLTVPIFNQSLVSINGACVAVGSPTPAGKTIIIGQGTFTGAGYFVGTGVFTALPGSGLPVYVAVNSSWQGTATGSCIGNGTFTAGNPTAVLSIDPRGAGTLSGQGTWTTPRGSFSGNGVFTGSDISLTGGNGQFTGSYGVLTGAGNVNGAGIVCIGQGTLSGPGAYYGAGTFVGQGVYVGTQATVHGTAVLLGAGQCQGAAVQKADPKAPLPGPLAVIKDTANQISARAAAAHIQFGGGPSPLAPSP